LINCPQCGSEKLFKSGLRHLASGEDIQRWLCRGCGYRFSDLIVKVNVLSQFLKGSNSAENHANGRVTDLDSFGKKVFDGFSFDGGEDVGAHDVSTIGKGINVLRIYSSEHRVCASKKAKNLDNQMETQRPSVGGTTETNADIKGHIVQFAFWMEKQGYSKETIRGNLGCLRALQNRNANLLDAESVKAVLAKEQKWSPNRRRNAINSYTLFLKVNGHIWEKPKCRVERKFPFIPTEAELNNLISGCGFKTSTFLLLLKETAMRSGEAKRIEWINVDSEKNIITLNDPEKGSKPRMWKVSTELIRMLKMLPKKSVKVFGDGPINSMKSTYMKARKRLAVKLQNPRLLNISFHTYRHWKATMLYHKTKDPYYVKDFLGHKCLSNTEIYINIERTLFEDQTDEFTVKVAENQEDIKALLESGFEYVCQKDNLVYMKKRK
jgi:integrase